MVVSDAGGERTKCDDMFSRLYTIGVCNGQTDRRTDILRQHSRTMHTRRAVKTAQNLSVGISRSNCFSSDKTATLTQRLLYHGSSVVSRKPLCH